MATALITATNTERDPRILERVEAYLWSGFEASLTDDGQVLITGEPWAGFTFEALRERLFSGLIATSIIEVPAVAPERPETVSAGADL